MLPAACHGAVVHEPPVARICGPCRVIPMRPAALQTARIPATCYGKHRTCGLSSAVFPITSSRSKNPALHSISQLSGLRFCARMATANLSTIDYWSHPSQPTLTIGHPSGPNHQFDLNTGGPRFCVGRSADTRFVLTGSFSAPMSRRAIMVCWCDPGRERNGFRQRERCHRRYTRTPIPAALPLFAAVSV